MTRFMSFSTAVMLPLMFATPMFAQAAIQEPGAFAFNYPNYDVLNGGGQPTPAARMDAIAGYGPFSGSYAYAAPDGAANGAYCAQRYRAHKLVSGMFADTSASEPARRRNESDRSWARQTRLHRQRCGLLYELCSGQNRGGRRSYQRHWRPVTLTMAGQGTSCPKHLHHGTTAKVFH
jgi:hypothetical protein